MNSQGNPSFLVARYRRIVLSSSPSIGCIPEFDPYSRRTHSVALSKLTMQSARRWQTIRLEISTDDSILHSLLRILHSLLRILHSLLRRLFRLLRSLHSLHSLLHRSKDNILHRSKVDIPHNILHSKHVDRLDDKPGERADGRIHNSTVH